MRLLIIIATLFIGGLQYDVSDSSSFQGPKPINESPF